jgi:phosphoribosyl-AMP cyclohydrolase
MKKTAKSTHGGDELKGWQEIAAFLGQPMAVAQRWTHSEGMPTERRGRYVFASREKLNQWLGRESSGEPVQISTEDTDLDAQLRRGLDFVRKKKRGHTRAA